MKRLTFNVFSYCCLSFFLSLTLLNTTQAQTQGTVVGVVNSTMVLSKSQKGKRLTQYFRKKNTADRAKINAQRKKITDIQDRIRLGSVTLNMEQITALKVKSEEEIARLNRITAEAKRSTEVEKQFELRKFREDIAPIIKRVAIRKGIDLVLTQNSNENNILYMSDRTDITDDVIQLLDESE